MTDIPQITQVAIVVEDLQATMKTYHETLGWGPWNVTEFRPPRYRDLTVDGQPADYGVLVAETQAGPIAFEILQPLDGDPNPYRQWLDQRGEGLHHIACMVHSSDAAADLNARLTAMGARDWTSGKVNDDLRFSFLDACATPLKTIIETGTGHTKELTPPDRIFPASP